MWGNGCFGCRGFTYKKEGDDWDDWDEGKMNRSPSGVVPERIRKGEGEKGRPDSED
ncbi:MAG: hypothetical protein NTZ69_18525 [Bacteroidia bacterium]|nr:hypothetical protein [Bacteroidia bacterium]